MKFMLVYVCVLVVLTHNAFCTDVSIKPVIRKHFEDLSKQHLHHAKQEWLSLGEEMVARTLREAGYQLCPGENIDWEGDMRIAEERGKQIDIEGETLCSLIENHIEYVFEPLTTTLDRCGEANRGGHFGSVIITVLKGFTKHVCSISGEQILEMVNVCSFKGRFTAPECDTFKKQIEEIQPGNTTRPLTVELCEIYPIGKYCFLDAVNQECQLEFTKKAWEDLFNEVLTPVCYT